MRKQKVLAKDFQFYFPELDNIVLVECHEDETVTIRASKNNVPEERKIIFIRKLAAEGFIPDNYQWFSGSTDGFNGVLWEKDYSWLKIRRIPKDRANRFMARLLVASCILLIATMRVLIISSLPGAVSKSTVVIPVDVHPVPPNSITGRVGDSLIPRQPLAELESEH
jgi:hypothetical protein